MQQGGMKDKGAKAGEDHLARNIMGRISALFYWSWAVKRPSLVARPQQQQSHILIWT
jgi:hypothetical protein